MQEPGPVTEQPVVTIGVPPEHVLGGDPDVAGGEHPALDRRAGVYRSPRTSQQNPDLLAAGHLHESTIVLENEIRVDVVGAQFHLAAAGQGAALAADLDPGDVGQHRLTVGGGEEFHHLGRREHVEDPLPESGRHARTHEEPDRVVAGRRGETRVRDDLAQHRPGVGDHGDAVLADLIEEAVRRKPTGQRDPRAGHHRSTQTDQQAGLVMQRGQAVHRVVPGQCGCRGGAEGRQRPPVVGDLFGFEHTTADRVEHHERDVAGVTGVRPIPAG